MVGVGTIVIFLKLHQNAFKQKNFDQNAKEKRNQFLKTMFLKQAKKHINVYCKGTF